jgi:hypothetical protein
MFGRLHRALCRFPKCKRRVLACIRGNAAHERSRLCRLAKATFVSRFTPSWLAHSTSSPVSPASAPSPTSGGSERPPGGARRVDRSKDLPPCRTSPAVSTTRTSMRRRGRRSRSGRASQRWRWTRAGCSPQRGTRRGCRDRCGGRRINPRGWDLSAAGVEQHGEETGATRAVLLDLAGTSDSGYVPSIRTPIPLNRAPYLRFVLLYLSIELLPSCSASPVPVDFLDSSGLLAEGGARGSGHLASGLAAPIRGCECRWVMEWCWSSGSGRAGRWGYPCEVRIGGDAVQWRRRCGKFTFRKYKVILSPVQLTKHEHSKSGYL